MKKIKHQNKLFGFKLKHIILILIVLLLVTALSFDKYAKFSFDLDEIFTVYNSKNINPFDYWTALNYDLGNPQLFVVLLKLFVLVSDSSDIWLRTLPLIFYLLSVWVFIKILNEFKISEKLRLLTVIIYLGLSPFWFFRFYVRAYSLLLLLILLTIYQSFKIIKNPRSIELKRLMIIIFFGFHSHYIYWIFNAIWIATLFFTGVLKKILTKLGSKKFFKIVGIGVISLFPIVINLVSRELINSVNRYYFFQLDLIHPSSLEILQFILKMDLNYNFFKLIDVFFWLILFVGGVLAIKKKTNKNQEIWLVFSILFWSVYFLTPLKNFLSVFKYISVFTLFVPISLVLILNKLFNLERSLKSKTIMLVSTMLVIVWSLLPPLKTIRVDYGDDWKTVVNKVSRSSINSAVVIDCIDKLGFDYYAIKSLEFYGFKGFSSGNHCGLPSIIDNAQVLENILVVGDGVLPLPIEDSHNLIFYSEKYFPIKFYYYQRK